MTFYMIVGPLIEEQDRVRREKGEAAAKECAHSQLGSALGSMGGAVAGAAAGSVVPVVGTIAGFLIGGVVGAIRGGEDKTAGDNMRSAVKFGQDVVKPL